MRKFTILFTIILLLTAACTSRKKKQKIDLSLKLTKGKAYRLVTDIKQNMVQTVHNVKQNIETSVRSDLSFLVKEHQGAHYILLLHYDEMHFKFEAPQAMVTFDSDQKPRIGNVSDQMYSQLIGKTFQLRMDRFGKIYSISGLDSLGKSIVDSLELDNPMLKAQLLGDFKGLFGNQALTGTLALFFSFYPKGKVKIGDRWSNTLTVQSPVPATFDNTYQLIDFDTTIAIIKGESIIEPIRDTSATADNTIKVDYDITGSQTSKIEVRRTDGWIKSVAIKSEINGTMNVKKNPQLPHGLKIPFRVSIHSFAQAK